MMKFYKSTKKEIKNSSEKMDEKVNEQIIE